MEKPSDIITVKEAIELIDSDTPTNPVVNNVELIKNVEYLRANFRGGGMNYTIHLVKRDSSGKIVPNGKKWVAVANSRDQHDLEYAITDHYKSRSGKDVDPAQLGLRKQTTVIDKQDPNSDGMAHYNKSSKLKYGSELGTSKENMTVEAY